MSTSPIQVAGGPAQPIYIMGPGIDEEKGILINIAWEHYLVHEGKMFTTGYSASVNNSANMDIRIAPGAASAELHCAISVVAGGQVTVYLYEAPTISVGTALTLVNLNRVSSRTMSWLFYHTPTVGAVGSNILINGRILPGGVTPQTRIGGGIRPGTEWEFDPTKEYLLRITNTSGATTVINPTFEFYEE